MIKFMQWMRGNHSIPSPNMGHKNGYLYVYYYNLDSLSSIAGFNARRVLKNKNPYPVIVSSEREKQALLTIRQNIISREAQIPEGKPERQSLQGVQQYLFGKFIIENNLNLAPSLQIIQKIALAVYKAVQDMDIRVGLNYLTAQDKLYLLGHSTGGNDLVRSLDDTSSDCNMQQYAQKLKEANLSKEIFDLRLDWCESANNQTAFKEVMLPPLKKKAAPGSVNDFLFWKRKMNTAQSLSYELYKLGYKDIFVHGYKGFGLVFPTEKSSPDFFKYRYMQLTKTYQLISKDPLKISTTSDFDDLIIASAAKKIYKNGQEIV